MVYNNILKYVPNFVTALIDKAFCALDVVSGTVLDELSLDDYRKYSELIEEDVYTEISLESCVKKRISEGSTGPESVDEQIKLARLFIESHRD